jgi:AAA+ ATPase superfamily predicted ATPase
MSPLLKLILYILLLPTWFLIGCDDKSNKKQITRLPPTQEELANKVAKSENYKAYHEIMMSMFKEIKKEASKLRSLRKRYSKDHLKHLKESPYYTEKEKNDSLIKMGYGKAKDYKISSTARELIKKSMEPYQKVKAEFPELGSLDSQAKRLVWKRIREIYIAKKDLF